MASEKKIKIGITGLGPRGNWLAYLFRNNPDYEIVGLSDRFVCKAENAAKSLQLPSSSVYENFADMLDCCPLDAVLIAVPPDIQVPMACEAMRRGLHVATEVPAAVSIEDCEILVKTVKETGVIYQLMEQTRYWGFIQTWKKMAQSGEFGKILFAEGEYMHYEEWDYFFDSATGEPICGSPFPPEMREVEESWRFRVLKHPIYYLPHTLSPLLSITGGRAVSVSCMGTRDDSYYVDGYKGRDIEIALMKLDNDTILKVSAGFLSPHGPRRDTGCHWYQVMGSKTTVEWARSLKDKPKLWKYGSGRDWEEKDWSVYAEDSGERARNSGHGGADSYPVETFAESIKTGKNVGMDVYQAVETAAPAILAAKSAEQGGKLIEIPDFRQLI